MKGNMQDLLSIVVCSCDAYQDALGPFFKLLTRYWPQCENYNIILNTESLGYDYKGLKITSYKLYDKKFQYPAWSKRLLDTLNKIESKYVLVLLDDFYLSKEVDNTRFNLCLEFMEQHNNLACVNVHHSPGHHVPLIECPLLAKRSKLSKYLINLQASIWRKDDLKKCLRAHESAWDLERFGSVREIFSKRDYYTVISPIFYYRPDLDGLSRGKWNHHTPSLFKSEGIDFDFSVRGVLKLGEVKPAAWNINFKKVWKSFFS